MCAAKVTNVGKLKNVNFRSREKYPFGQAGNGCFSRRRFFRFWKIIFPISKTTAD
jgi:hypothetical protein